MSTLSDIREATIKGDQEGVRRLIHNALDENIPTDDIIKAGLIPAMEIVGKNFAEATIFIPEMLIAAHAMKAGMEVLKPHFLDGKMDTLGKVVIGTIQGDLHDIGKNLVGMMMEGAGLEVIDLGIDIAPKVFVSAVKEHKPQFLGMSALLTTTMPAMEHVVGALEQAGLRDTVKIIIGGAPVTREFADTIGADGYGANASEAVYRIKEFLDQG